MPQVGELQRQRTAGALTECRAGRPLGLLPGVILSLGCLFLVGALFPPFVFAQATLENPAPHSFQSGIGVISGWACNARRIEIVFNGGPPQEAAYGTSRGDTQAACGDTDNGFGLLFNWNLLDDGVHTVQALADGVEFASVTVIVTTLGTEFLRGASGTVPLTDWPTPGSTLTLRWQQAQQNFAITDGSSGRGGGTSGAPPHVLDIPVPGSFQSGLGVISGWACNARRIEITFDDGPPQEAAYGTSRGDTAQACGDTDNGFGLLFNWNLLGDGPHTVAASADGVEFARVEVTVTTLGREVQRGLSHEVVIPGFPDVGTDVVLQWQEAQQNFVITTVLPTQQQVAVTPVVTLPAGVQIPNVAVRSLYAETAEVLASPKPSLLLAEDGEGTVLLGVANRDGGLLGERDGRVAVSVDSTAVVLVALRAGFAVHEIDQEVVDAIQGHADYADLALTLAVLVEADKNFLDTLLSYPDVVETIETISGIFGANGPHSRRGLSLKYSRVASAGEAGRVHSPLQGITGEIDEDDCSHRAALWSMAEGADIAAMFAPVESVAAALRRAATAEQPPPPADPSDPQVTEELSLREIMKFFTDLTAEQHAGRGTGTSSAPETQPAGAGTCRDPSAPGDGGGEWWDLAMRGYMDHRGTGGAEQENPFLACLPPDSSEPERQAREALVARCMECQNRSSEDPLVSHHWLSCYETRQHSNPAWQIRTGLDFYDVSWGRCVNFDLYPGFDQDELCQENVAIEDYRRFYSTVGRTVCERYRQQCPPPVPDIAIIPPSDAEDGDPRWDNWFALTSCGRPVEAEAAEEPELCKSFRTYRREGCTGGRECIVIREPVWEPCRQPTLSQRFYGRAKYLSRKLFEYLCEKECTPDGEVRCKVRKSRSVAIGRRG